MKSVIQEWTQTLPLMQQTVLLTAVRGPDGIAKYSSVKMLLRWFRRCILVSALDGKVLTDPCDPSGGSFTGPSSGASASKWELALNGYVDEYVKELDALPHHFQLHFMHASEILGYKHPDDRIRAWWHGLYLRLVNDMHLCPEPEDVMDDRLGDTRAGWLRRADPATSL